MSITFHGTVEWKSYLDGGEDFFLYFLPKEQNKQVMLAFTKLTFTKDKLESLYKSIGEGIEMTISGRLVTPENPSPFPNTLDQQIIVDDVFLQI